MDYIKINSKHTVRVDAPVWDFVRKGDIVRVTFFRYGFFLTVEYFYKYNSLAQKAAMALRAGMTEIPAPDLPPRVCLDVARGRMR